ncbi:putative HTH-type transcriptional regulator [uncultured archaeon]|nr:putative HTH-type transcriptional regulator [uncultured archaeon]
MKIDDLDTQILENLQSDARMSLRELGQKLGVPHTTVFTRVNRLVERGVIDQFTAKINPHDLGLKLGIIMIDAHPSESKKIAEEIAQHEEVQKVFRTFDGKIIVKVVVPNAEENVGFEEFLKKLDGHHMTVYPVHEVVKFEHTIPRSLLDHVKSERTKRGRKQKEATS